MSAPAQNAFSPAPVSTMTLISSSASSLSRASISSCESCALSALRFSGRFSRTVATAPVFSTMRLVWSTLDFLNNEVDSL